MAEPIQSVRSDDRWLRRGAPPPGQGIIPRRRLLDRLARGLAAPLTLVSAPAGFGKTTLLVDWAATCPARVAWLTLDPRHRDLRRLAVDLVAALEPCLPGCGAEVLDLCRRRAEAADIGAALADALAPLRDDLVLVLDDVQLAASADVDAVLAALIRTAPPTLHLIVSTRNDPALPLARMRLLGEVVEVRAADLQFTDDETASLLALGGYPVDPALVAAIHHQTGGWIAGLRLALLALPTVEDPTRIADAVAANRHLMDFLVEEVLGAQPSDTARLLVSTAIVDRLCPPLADAILGETGGPTSRGIIERVVRENLFLARADEPGEWYRHHPLFRSLLMHQLHLRAAPGEEAALRLRASAWFAAHGHLDEAIRQRVAAGDAAGAAELVEGHAHAALDREDWTSVAGWLALLPDATVRRRPALLLAKGWVSRFSGRTAPIRAMLIQVADLLSGTDFDDATRERLDAEREVLAAVSADPSPRDPEGELAHLHSVLSRVSPADRLPFGLAGFSYGCALQAVGRTDEAIRWLTDATHRDEERIDAGTIRALGGLMWVHRQAGNYPACRDAASHVLTLATRDGLPVAAGWGHWMLGWLAYQRDDLEAAGHHFAAILADRDRVHLQCACEASAGLALTQQARGQAADADATVRLALEMVLDANALEYLPMLRAFKARLALRQDAPERASDWLAVDDGVGVGCNSLDAFDHAFVTRIRVLAALGGAEQRAAARRDIAAFSRFAAAVHHRGHEIDLLVLAAIAAEDADGDAGPLPSLRRAIALATAGGLIRPFVDAGAGVRPLLRRLAEEDATPFLGRLLAATGAGADPAPDPVAEFSARPVDAPRPSSIDALTTRELAVLGCLSRRLSYREIADELFIALPTVKTHVRNVYDKLGVSSRRDALTAADGLGLTAVHAREVFGTATGA